MTELPHHSLPGNRQRPIALQSHLVHLQYFDKRPAPPSDKKRKLCKAHGFDFEVADLKAINRLIMKEYLDEFNGKVPA